MGSCVCIGALLAVWGCASSTHSVASSPASRTVPAASNHPSVQSSDPHGSAPRSSNVASSSGRSSATSGIDFSALADGIFSHAGERFSGLIIDQDQGRIVAYWVGDVPAEVEELATTFPLGVDVQLEGGAAHSRLELSSAAERVTTSAAGSKAGVSAVAVLPNGSGLKIDVAGEVPTGALAAEVAAVAQLPLGSIAYTPFSAVVPL